MQNEWSVGLERRPLARKCQPVDGIVGGVAVVVLSTGSPGIQVRCAISANPFRCIPLAADGYVSCFRDGGLSNGFVKSTPYNGSRMVRFI